MGQCKKILEGGKQCSNRAIPGTDYCEEHKLRIKFRLIRGGVQTESEKAPETIKNWKARPCALGDKPEFPGLTPDKRNILTAAAGVIRMTEKDLEDKTISLFERQVAVLSYISQEIHMAGHVRIMNDKSGDGLLIQVTPPSPDSPDLSRHYDMLAAAAELSGGFLYIGEDRTFIRYRDENAPSGYDAPDVKAPGGKDIYLIDIDGVIVINGEGLSEDPIDQLLLRIPPGPKRGDSPPERIWCLCDPSLYLLVSRYLRAHHLSYSVARFRNSEGRAANLFDITPRADAPTGTAVPRFAVAWLQGLPRCAVLTEREAGSGGTILVEHGFRYPCRHIGDVFEEGGLVLFVAGPDFHNMCIAPAPAFFDGDRLAAVRTTRGEAAIMEPGNEEAAPLEIPLKLMHNTGPVPFPAALILDEKETLWLRNLVKQLPENMFHRYSICLGKPYSVLIGGECPIEGVPFGVPLRSVKDTQLFIPLLSKMIPELPWTLLSQVLNINEGVYTFLGPDFRMDVPIKNFVSLSRSLAFDSRSPKVDIELVPMKDLPDLVWTPPPKPEQNETGIIGKITGRKKKENTAGESGKTPMNTEESLRNQAGDYQEKGDFLSAGLCFTIVEDHTNAARCFKSIAGISEE